MATNVLQTVRIKVASASLNQTVYDFSKNVPNILAAIDRAVIDGADILSLEELTLTGYAADDYHQWNKDNNAVWPLIELIANYANQQNPNLVISLGTPWHYADKSQSADDPAYNINNRPFNSQFTITGGQVVAIAAKSILADGPAEYEPRQFNDWPLSKGTIPITLPNGTVVPFGKPIVLLGNKDAGITLTHEICAEGWPGVYDDLSINAREQNEARHIVAIAQRSDLSVVLNPSASKPQPAINKEHIRAKGLCETGSQYCGLFVYTNFLGSSSGTYAAEGSQLYAQNGKIIHHGQRYYFGDVSYSSAAVDVPMAKRGTADATIYHQFKTTELALVGHEAEFDNAFNKGLITTAQLTYEEYMRSIALWLRDYLTKQDWPAQGYVISLSGGKDSAYGAVANSIKIDLMVKELGIEGFLQQFNQLKYKDDILEIYRNAGEIAAIDAIKYHISTYVYLPSENTSERTLNAARFLIEGGTLPDGSIVKGIGGKFIVAPVQGIINEIHAAYVGLNLDKLAAEKYPEILGPGYDSLTAEDQIILARGKALSAVRIYVDAELGTQPVLPGYLKAYAHYLPSWANPKFDTTLQNTQARGRLPLPWAIANDEGKIALVTSNESEAVLGYTTAGGDMHMGGANPIGGMPKDTISASLLYLENEGLVGLGPIKSLYYVNAEKPSAELRKVVEGAVQQTDETDLGFSYAQAKFLVTELILNRRKPVQVLQDIRHSPLFPDDPVALRKILLGCTNRWAAAQFKLVMGTLAPHVGDNVDPHQAVRTTVLGDHFKTWCAEMTLEILAEKIGGATAFEQTYGMTVPVAHVLAMINHDFKTALIKWPIERLLQPTEWQSFRQSNNGYRQYIKVTTRPVTPTSEAQSEHLTP